MELFEQVVDLFGFGHEVSRTKQRLPGEIVFFFQVCQQVFHIEHAFYGIEVFMVHRKAGIAVFDHDVFHMLETVFDVEGNHVDAGTDDVDGRYVAETDNPFQNFFLVVNIRVLRQFQRFG